MFQLLPAFYNSEMRAGEEMLCSRFKLLGICYSIAHSSYVSKDNQSFKKNTVYINCFLLLLALLQKFLVLSLDLSFVL